MFSELITGFGVVLTPITLSDIEKVRRWRNHPEVTKYMFDQRPISAFQQKSWFATLATRNDIGVWLVMYKGIAVGVINVRTENGTPVQGTKKLEPGFYMAPDSPYRNSVLAFSPSLALIDYFFSRGVTLMEAKVKSNNKAALRYNQSLGYDIVESVPQLQDAETHLMQLEPRTFDLAKKKLTKIIRF